MAKLKAGSSLGPYTLLERIDNADGSNGYVWSVESSDKPLVIKFLKMRNPSSKKYQRFVDEIYAMQQCSDLEGVLPIIDSHAPQTFDQEDPAWYVMPRAATLESIRATLGVHDAVAACASFAETLQEMHSREIAHRDLKPDNLFYLDDSWRIGDFGLVQFVDKAAVSSDNERIGPLLYNAPEMFNDAIRSDGKAADVFSLAKILWVLLTGQKYPTPGQVDASDERSRASSYVQEEDITLLDRLIELATSSDPSQRPTATIVCTELKYWLNRKDDRYDSELKGIDLSDFHRIAEVEQPRVQAERQEQFQNQTAAFNHLCETFLHRFDNLIDDMYVEFEKLGSCVSPQKHLQQAGPSHIHAVIGEADLPPNAYVYQHVAMMQLRSQSTGRYFPFVCGICVIQPGQVSEAGYFPVANSVSQVGAAIYFDDDQLDVPSRFITPWRVETELVLGGSSEQAFISGVLNEMPDVFRSSFAAFRDYVAQH